MARNEGEPKEYTLEEREYVGEDGKIHHHTNVWMREHAHELEAQRASGGKGESGGESRSRSKEGSRESEGAEERERGGISKVAVAAAAVGVAAVAAVAVAAARRGREGAETEEPREPAAAPRRQDEEREGGPRAV